MISPQTIERVRDRADIVAVISETVPSLKRRGRSYVGLCPFHKEKTGSFHVNPDRGFFHCFGCKESGSVIDFVMKQEGATFPEAVRSIAERYNIEVEDDHAQDRPEQDRLKKLRDDLYAVNQVAAAFFEEQMRTHEHASFAHDELARREIPFGSGEEVDVALRAFRIGYAPSGWDGLAVHLKKSGISPFAGEQVGLLVPRSGTVQGHYDRFRHRLMFSVVDEKGRVVAFSGRALAPAPGDDPTKDPPAKYINSPESPIYTKGKTLFGLHQARHAVRQEEEAVLVEGNFDVVSLHARGINNVLAPLGTAFTVDQAKLLRRFASKIVLAFDGDAAGKKATRTAREAIREAGLSARVMKIPEGKDPDELVRVRGRKGFEDALAQSKEMKDYLLAELLDQTFTTSSPMEKNQRLQEVIALLRQEDDPLVRSLLKSTVDELAGRLDIVGASGDAFLQLENAVKRALAAERLKGPPAATPRDAKVRARVPGSEERTAMVRTLLEYPSLLSDPDVENELVMLEGTSVEMVVAIRQSWDFEMRKLDLDTFFAALSPRLKAYAEGVLADPRPFDEKESKEYLLENSKKLKRLLLAQSTTELARENYRAEGDWEEDAGRAREAVERMREKHGVKDS